MLTRRDFLQKTITGFAAGAAVSAGGLWADGKLAWPKPIGLQLYTVRDQYRQDAEGTLKKVGAIGYREVDLAGFLPPHLPPATLKSYLRAANLKPISDYLGMPKTADDWKKSVDEAHANGVSYIVTGNTDRIDAEAWKRLADLFNQCGKLSAAAGLQFAYHNHIREFERLGNTSGYEILLTRCDPKLVKMEMDIFWITYSGVDPLPYFKRFPGRFPLLHIKDMKKGITVNPNEFPPENGPNPFAPVGQGRIDWPKIFAHVGQAGTKHIFVEQDRCDGSPFDALKTSFKYLKNLRLS
ncbi:MAG: sugar phosphate isomerase/epimerase family protein [Terriglobia bacterium]